MADLNLNTLTEADIITKRVMPAILDAGWNDTTQIRQEVKLRDGKVIVRGKVALSGLHACSDNYYERPVAGGSRFHHRLQIRCQSDTRLHCADGQAAGAGRTSVITFAASGVQAVRT